MHAAEKMHPASPPYAPAFPPPLAEIRRLFSQYTRMEGKSHSGVTRAMHVHNGTLARSHSGYPVGTYADLWTLRPDANGAGGFVLQKE